LIWEDAKMPITIGRNRRQYVINVRDAYTVCERYDPETDSWETVDPEEAWHMLDTRKDARLVEQDDKKSYWITVQNQRYVLWKPQRD
jgi:hypothetical protein